MSKNHSSSLLGILINNIYVNLEAEITYFGDILKPVNAAYFLISSSVSIHSQDLFITQYAHINGTVQRNIVHNITLCMSVVISFSNWHIGTTLVFAIILVLFRRA